MEKNRYVFFPKATKLLVTVAASKKLWKGELQKLADEIGLDIYVCHFPTGTRKWNQIEYSIFSLMSMSWKGRPLVSHEVIIHIIRSTTAKPSLETAWNLHINNSKRIAINDEKRRKELHIEKDNLSSEWNYIIKPIV